MEPYIIDILMILFELVKFLFYKEVHLSILYIFIAATINGHALLGAIGLVPLTSDRRGTAAQSPQNERMVRSSGVCVAV